MSFLKHYLFVPIAFITMLNAVVPILPSEINSQLNPFKAPEIAQAQTNGPAIRTGVADLGCSQQGQDWGYAAFPGGRAWVTDTNGKDVDCAKIGIDAGNVTVPASERDKRSIYNYDFRIGITVSESENSCSRDAGMIAWTQWATEIDGIHESGPTVGQNGMVAADCVNVHFETRALPDRKIIKNVSVGIKVGNGGWQDTLNVLDGGGWSSNSRAGDFTTAQVRMTVDSATVPNDADYISTTIPQTPQTLNPGNTQNYNIVMKNQGGSWETDLPGTRTIQSSTPMPSGNNCDTWQPAAANQTCVEAVPMTSTKYKLRRTDTNRTAVTTATDIAYTVNTTHTYSAIRAYTTECVDVIDDGENGGGIRPPIREIQTFLNPFIKKAHAAPPGMVCYRVPAVNAQGEPIYNKIGPVISPTKDIQLGQEVQFNFPLTPGNTPGTYQLKFQMVHVPSNALFAATEHAQAPYTVATINVQIGTIRDFSMNNCGVTKTVNATSSPSSFTTYTVSASVTNFTDPITVTMASSPTGPTANPASVQLVSPTYASSMNVYYGNLSAGTYNLTFTGVAGGLSPRTCPATLIIVNPPIGVDIKFNQSDNPDDIAVGATGEIWWRTQNALSCQANTSPVTTPQTWIGSKLPTNASPRTETSSPLNAESHVFGIQCLGINNTTASDTVTVYTSGVPAPTVDLKCTGRDGIENTSQCLVGYGRAGTLAWDSTNAESCIIDNAIGKVETSGRDQSTGNLEINTVFGITCDGPSGSVSDSVTFRTDEANPTFTMDCDPMALNIIQGSTGSVVITTGSIDGFKGEVTISVGSITPQPANSPSITFEGNDQIPPATTVALIGTSTNTSVGTYTIRFNGSGSRITNGCDVTLNVTPQSPPNPPIVTTDNRQCGVIMLSWTLGAVPPTPTGFKVFHRDSAVGAYEVISGTEPLAANVRSFTHSGIEGRSNNYYKVIAYNNGIASAETNNINVVGPVGGRSCTAVISQSDKEVIGVSGRIKRSFNPPSCTGEPSLATLPNNALFAVNDIVTFKLNICNSGPVSLTGITVLDTMSNLSEPSIPTSSEDCMSSYTFNEDGTIEFILRDIGGVQGGGQTRVCSITYSAKVTAPEDPTAAIYRFQNVGVITADNDISGRIYTHPYLFSLTGGVPDRNETGPQ